MHPVRPIVGEWRSLTIVNATDEQLLDGVLLNACTVAYNAVKPKRTEIIEAALSVESALDSVLLDLLAGLPPERRLVVRELIVAAEFCTFHQKWTMLRRLFDLEVSYFASLSDTDGKELRRDLRKVISDRNKFAHGEMFVDANNLAVTVQYFEDGTKTKEVNESWVSEMLLRSHEVRDTLMKLHVGWERAQNGR